MTDTTKPRTKKWLLTAGLPLAAIIIFLAIQPHSSANSTQAVQLVITGPEGQKFTGSYVADGKTNLLSGVVPTTITIRVRQLTYHFQPEDRREEFRVVLAVENLSRTSRISYQGGPIDGGWHCWHYDLRKLRDMVFSGDIFKKQWSYWIRGEAYW
jgi:hypothetical protein